LKFFYEKLVCTKYFCSQVFNLIYLFNIYSKMMSGTASERSTKFCRYCGAEIDARAEICPKCGVRVEAPPQTIPRPPVTPYSVSTPKKNEGVAAVLSLIFVGLGQIYNGQIGKGIWFIIAGVVCLILTIVLIGFVLYFVLWVYNIYDAYNTAKKINAGTITT